MTSQEYWAQREAEQLRHNLTDEAEIEKKIEKMYRQTLREAKTQIEAFYSRYARSEGLTLAEARRKVTELDIKDYEAKAEKYVRLKDMSAQANAEMKLYNAAMRINRLEMLKAEIGLELCKNTAELEELLEDTLTDRTLEELERQAGILGTTIKNNSRLARSIVNASYQNGTFSERLWGNQVTLRTAIESLLVSGIIQGKGPVELAPKLEKAFGTSKYAAERLMRTELARVQTDAQMASFKDGGYDQYMFITVGAAACPVCRALNGKVFKVSEMAPGENAPPIHPNCRCSTAAYMDREKLFEESEKGENLYEGVPKSWKQLKSTEQDDLKVINPNYKRLIKTTNVNEWEKGEIYGYNWNCVNCVVAYDARQRGYDVEARPYTECDLRKKAAKAWEGVKATKVTGNVFDQIREKIMDVQGEARYFIGINNDDGHAIVLKKNNDSSITLIDPQQATVYTEIEVMVKLLGNDCDYWRIDNIELSQTGINACKGR